MPRILAITGMRGAGKTTRILEMAGQYAGRGLRVGGIVQPAYLFEGRRAGYELMDVATGERRPFASRRQDSAPGMAWVFDPTGWTWAAERIRWARETCDVVVVDELGRLEIEGGGHLPALLAPGRVEGVWLLGVRLEGMDAIQERIGGDWEIVRI